MTRFAAFSESNINCLILKLSKQQFLCQDLTRHRSLQYNRERFRRPRVFSFTPWDWKLVMRRLLITKLSHMRRSDCNLFLRSCLINTRSRVSWHASRRKTFFGAVRMRTVFWYIEYLWCCVEDISFTSSFSSTCE